MFLGDTATEDNYWKMEIDDAGVGNTHRANVTATTGRTITGSGGLNLNQWYLSTFVIRSPTDYELYLDGVSEGADTLSRAPTSVDAIALGREIDSTGDDSFLGQLDFGCVWDTDLDDAEIAALAKGVYPTLIRPASLKSCVRVLSETLAMDLVSQRTFTRVALTAYTGEPAPVNIYPSSQILQFPPAAAAAGVFDIFSPGIITGAPAL